MSKHFAYLVDDDSADFFQKVACEAVDKTLPPATAPAHLIEKVAAVGELEKVAARVELDIEIIKTAGESGFNFGAIHRGLNYVDGLVHREQLNLQVADQIFDKVAAASIEKDLDVIHDHLLKMAGEENRAWVDGTLAGVGVELVKAAELDKQALLGVVRGLKAMKGALGASKGLGAATRMKAVAKAPSQSLKAWRTESAVAKRGKAALKLKGAVSKAKAAERAQLAKVRLAKGIKDPAVKRSVLPGVEAKAGKVTEKAKGKVQKASDRFIGRQAKVRERRAIEAGKKPNATAQDATPKASKVVAEKSNATQNKAEVARSKAKNKAELATKPSEEATRYGKNPAKKGAGGDVKDPGMMNSLRKLRDKGWKNLSPEEKNKVIQAGAGAYIAKETLT